MTKYINVVGKQEVSNVINGKEKTNTLMWDTKYDGKKAVVNMASNIDGKKKKETVELSNKDLEKLFVVPASKEKLTERLHNDFLSTHHFGRNKDCRVSIVPMDMSDPVRLIPTSNDAPT